jgi:hypothetical protein
VVDAIKITNFFAGQIVKVLKLYRKSDSKFNEFQVRLIETLFELQHEVKNGKIHLARIREVLNQKMPLSAQLTSEKVSSILSGLGLKTEKSTGNLSFLIWEPQRIEQLFSRITVTTVTTAPNIEALREEGLLSGNS